MHHCISRVVFSKELHLSTWYILYGVVDTVNLTVLNIGTQHVLYIVQCTVHCTILLNG